MYDATYEEICQLQERLYREKGITQEELNLHKYAGLTYREIEGIVITAKPKAKKSESEVK